MPVILTALLFGAAPSSAAGAGVSQWSIAASPMSCAVAAAGSPDAAGRIVITQPIIYPTTWFDYRPATAIAKLPTTGQIAIGMNEPIAVDIERPPAGTPQGTVRAKSAKSLLSALTNVRHLALGSGADTSSFDLPDGAAMIAALSKCRSERIDQWGGSALAFGDEVVDLASGDPASLVDPR